MTKAALGDLCRFVTGGTPSKSNPAYWSGHIPWITSADIVGPMVTAGRAFITEEALCSSATNRVAPGTVLLVTRTGVGKVAIAENELCFSQDITALLPDPCKLDVSYLVQFLRANTRHFEQHSRGATIKGITRSVVAEMPIPLPPLAEQRRIAAILDQADALRAKRRASIALLDTLAQSIFLDMFGEPNTAGGRYPTVPLGQHLTFVTSGSRGWAQFYADSGARFVRSLDVRMNAISDEDSVYVRPPDNAEARRTEVQSQDVLLTITGSRIGRVVAAPSSLEGAYVSQHVAILRLDKCSLSPQFVAYFLSMPGGGQRQIENAQYGQTKPGLNLDQIRRFQIPKPPVEIQHEFEDRVRSANMLKASLLCSLTHLDELFASLQHRAFRGEL